MTDERRPANRKAVYSLVMAALGVLCVFVAPFGGFVLGVVAITSGIQAHREIADPASVTGGEQLATWGVAFGGSAMALALVAWVVSSTLG